MINYFKYLPTSIEDEKWGLHVVNAGCNRIDKNADYPAAKHPNHHYFNWSRGRILNEYQIIYISRGEGIFESSSCKKRVVKAGSILLLFPAEWHRFKPSKGTGWDEAWVGFKGKIIETICKNFFPRELPVLEVGLDEKIFTLFTEIVEKTKEEKADYQPLVSGIVMHLLGEVHSKMKQKSFVQEDNTAAIIKKAVMILRTKIDDDIAMERVAEELNVSYAWFRKAFKNYTGIAPHQYLLQLRIEKAKILLADHNLSVKQIALLLNLESSAYFSRLFKEKTGLSPELFRTNMHVV